MSASSKGEETELKNLPPLSSWEVKEQASNPGLSGPWAMLPGTPAASLPHRLIPQVCTSRSVGPDEGSGGDPRRGAAPRGAGPRRCWDMLLPVPRRSLSAGLQEGDRNGQQWHHFAVSVQNSLQRIAFKVCSMYLESEGFCI